MDFSETEGSKKNEKSNIGSTINNGLIRLGSKTEINAHVSKKSLYKN